MCVFGENRGTVSSREHGKETFSKDPRSSFKRERGRKKGEKKDKKGAGIRPRTVRMRSSHSRNRRVARCCILEARNDFTRVRDDIECMFHVPDGEMGVVVDVVGPLGSEDGEPTTCLTVVWQGNERALKGRAKGSSRGQGLSWELEDAELVVVTCGKDTFAPAVCGGTKM